MRVLQFGDFGKHIKKYKLGCDFFNDIKRNFSTNVLLKQDKYGKIYKKLVAFDLDGSSSKLQKEGTFCAVVKMES